MDCINLNSGEQLITRFLDNSSMILGVLLTILEIVFGSQKNNRSIARKYLNPAFIGAKLFEIVRNA